jgi:hypothetical protein
MEKVRTELPLNYHTIRLTASRIDKGLLAIPASLADMFPKDANHITILGGSGKEERKTFTPYTSSSRECRIGSLKGFFTMHQLKDGDEVVVIKLDDGKYRILPEELFKQRLLNAFALFENSATDADSDSAIKQLKMFSNESENTLLANEFVRLSQATAIMQRAEDKHVPAFMRRILLSLYKGKCQITNFAFMERNGMPYFEVHHIDAAKGNHTKNLLVVSPNIHRQFHYADMTRFYDKDNWLRSVRFGDDYYAVFQVIDRLQGTFEKEVHF